jgi:hypothetical protein
VSASAGAAIHAPAAGAWEARASSTLGNPCLLAWTRLPGAPAPLGHPGRRGGDAARPSVGPSRAAPATPVRQRASATERAVAFLRAAQQPDGGFAEAGGVSDPGLTAWVVLALDAAGTDPAAVTRAGRSAADYLENKPHAVATDLELRILANVALGSVAPGPIAQLQRLVAESGAIGPTLNSTMWGIVALRAARRAVPRAAVSYLRAGQHRSGGFSWAPRAAPDTNDTAAALFAFRAAGVPTGDPAVVRARAWLAAQQTRDGGMPLGPGDPADAQSTAWAIQGLLAGGRTPSPALRSFLLRLQRRDGGFRYAPGRDVTPVWVTAQVLPALLGRFPPYP